MEAIKQPQQTLTSKVKEYIILQKELIKVEASDKGAKLGTSVLTLLSFGSILLLGFMLIAMSIGFLLNSLLESPFLGFLIVGFGVIIIALAAYYFGKNKLKEILSFKILKVLNS